MKTVTIRLKFDTKGSGDLIDITLPIQDALVKSNLNEGTVNIFVIGSTAAITAFEYESGLISDMKDAYERLAPRNKQYRHDETWNDANGSSHVRAALQGPSITVPFQGKRLILGTWQQIVLAEFDTRSRNREIILTFLGK